MLLWLSSPTSQFKLLKFWLQRLRPSKCVSRLLRMRSATLIFTRLLVRIQKVFFQQFLVTKPLLSLNQLEKVSLTTKLVIWSFHATLLNAANGTVSSVILIELTYVQKCVLLKEKVSCQMELQDSVLWMVK